MSDLRVQHLGPQEFVEFEVNSRETMRVKVAYLGPVPGTDKVSIATEVMYWGELEEEGD